MNNSNHTTLEMAEGERVARDDMGRTRDVGEMLYHKTATLHWEISYHKMATYQGETVLADVAGGNIVM